MPRTLVRVCCMVVFLAAALRAAAPSAARAADLEIRDVKAAYGPLGPERPSLDVVPGDEIFFRYTIAGLSTDEAGRARGELRVRVTGPEGSVLIDEKEAIGGLLALGGGSLPGTARVSFGPDTAPGDFTLSVTIADEIGKGAASFERKLTCTKLRFALVRVGFSRDANGEIPAAAGGVVGETLHIRSKAVGFERAKATPHVRFTLQILDAANQPLLPEPVRAEFAPATDAGSTDEIALVDFQGRIVLNRVQIRAADVTGDRTAEFVAPLRVTVP